jgi:MoxR-like ATPase
MLEAMQERKVSIGGQDHDLPDPFFVLATQNPIEQEGTYPLPEAQLDRFMFHIKVDYPNSDEEIDIMKMATGEAPEKPNAVLNAEQIIDLQRIVRKMPVSDHVFEYARQLVRVTRVTTDEALPLCKKWLSWGAGPRAGLNMIMAAKAYAMIQGRVHVATEDIAVMAAPVLRHRIIPNFSATSEGLTTDDIIERILEEVPQKEKLS